MCKLDWYIFFFAGKLDWYYNIVLLLELYVTLYYIILLSDLYIILCKLARYIHYMFLYIFHVFKVTYHLIIGMIFW
jgi:hypothetical protein